MADFVLFDRGQAFPLPPDLEAWLPENDSAHVVVAAVDRVPLGVFEVPTRAGGKPQYHPRLMSALLIYSYANGIFSSRRIEQATYRDIAVRFVAANLHPDHDAIAVFRRSNKAAIEAAFLHVLLLARASGLLRLGTVSMDAPKIDANASKICSLRYNRTLRPGKGTAGQTVDRHRMADGAGRHGRCRGSRLAGPSGGVGSAGSAQGKAGCRVRAAGGQSKGRGRSGAPGL